MTVRELNTRRKNGRARIEYAPGMRAQHAAAADQNWKRRLLSCSAILARTSFSAASLETFTEQTRPASLVRVTGWAERVEHALLNCLANDGPRRLSSSPKSTHSLPSPLPSF